MPTYELSQTFYFRENGQKLEPGQTIELTEEQAEMHNHNVPGLLKPVRQTTQRQVDAVRAPRRKTTRLKK